MNVLSLFDGISCARVALECLGYKPTYYASEVDKYAIQIAQKNYPDTIQLGDVRSVKATALPQIDLLIGGSPCQDLSIAKANRKGLDGERSGLFWEYVRILHEVKPRYFVLENVNSMPKEAKRIITEAMGIEPIMIDAALVSAQRRKRLFWTNIPNVTLPEDRGILLKDILESGMPDDRMTSDGGKAFVITASYNSAQERHSVKMRTKTMVIDKPDRIGEIGNVACLTTKRTEDGKKYRRENNGTNPYSLTAKMPRNDGKTGTLTSVTKDNLIQTDCIIRKLTPVECERLQSLPDNYTDGISNTQRYKCLGNAFNVEVVRHILSFMDKGEWNETETSNNLC